MGWCRPSAVIHKTDIYLDINNHSQTEGGYYIEWRPQFDVNEMTENVVILSLNGSSGVLYYDYWQKN